MNKKTFSVLAVFVFLLGLSASLDAGRQRLRRPNFLQNLKFGLQMAENNLFEARFLLRMKDEIGLSSEQRQRIENMMLSYEEGAIQRGADVKVMELKFATLLKRDKVNRKEMEKMARDIGQIKTDIQVDHLNYLLDLRDLLTPDQIGKLENLKRQFKDRIKDRFLERREDRKNSPPPPPEEENPSSDDDSPM